MELFVIGLFIGSFLNVVIYRLPAGQSVLCPSSHCPHCRRPLRWYELLPVLSYLWKMGKCTYCRTPLTFQYPLIELVTGSLFYGLYCLYGYNMKLLYALIFISLLIPLVVIDIKHQIIPDMLNLTGAFLGGATMVLGNLSAADAFWGAAAGGGIMLTIALLSRGGMGGGDIKMMAWMGLFLGGKLTLLALFLSFIIGGLVCGLLIFSRIKKRKDLIPFGPFLATGGFTAYVFGREILTWYFTGL